MVLQKRNANGEFVVWSKDGGAKTPSAPPPTKRARVEVERVVPRTPSPPLYHKPAPSSYAPPATTSYRAPAAFPMECVSAPQAGPSSVSAPVPTQRGRKRKANADEPPPEKRLARFKPNCPQATLERVERVQSQTFYMIERERSPGELKETFQVLGSVGNVYTVTIAQLPSCTCPDFLKGNHCKHILFIYAKVLCVPLTSTHWFQKALLTSELQEIFDNAPQAPNSLARPEIREAYARATGRTPSASSSSQAARANSKTNPKRVPGPDDDCPICYDGMHGVPEAKLTYCAQCGNALHAACFAQWAKTAAASGKGLTCVWCRAAWVGPGGAAAAGGTGAGRGTGAGVGRSVEGYLNLAGVAGLSPVRDTSTYYHGPRRGRRYMGYNDYGFC